MALKIATATDLKQQEKKKTAEQNRIVSTQIDHFEVCVVYKLLKITYIVDRSELPVVVVAVPPLFPIEF